MGIFSWLPLRASSPALVKPKSPVTDSPAKESDDLSFNDIADQLERLHAHNAILKEQLNQSNQRANILRNESGGLRSQLKAAHSEAQLCKQRLREAEANAGRKNKAHKAGTKTLEDHINRLRAEKRALEHTRDRDLAFLRTKLLAVTSDYDSMMEFEDKLRKSGEDARLQLEYIKCTTSSRFFSELFMEDKSMPLVAQPFVVMLIDGDAYGVSAPRASDSGLAFSAMHDSSWGPPVVHTRNCIPTKLPLRCFNPR